MPGHSMKAQDSDLHLTETQTAQCSGMYCNIGHQAGDVLADTSIRKIGRCSAKWMKNCIGRRAVAWSDPFSRSSPICLRSEQPTDPDSTVWKPAYFPWYSNAASFCGYRSVLGRHVLYVKTTGTLTWPDCFMAESDFSGP